MRRSTSRLLTTAAGLALVAMPLAAGPAMAQEDDASQIEVTSYTQSEGLNNGRHDTASAAFATTADTDVVLGFRVLSVAEGELSDVTLTNKVSGSDQAKVIDLTCQVPATSGATGANGVIGKLAPHEQATCTATLTGLAAGQHEVLSEVTATLTKEDGSTTAVRDADIWYAAVTGGTGSEASTPTPKPSPTARATGTPTTSPTPDGGKGEPPRKGVVAGDELAMVNPALIGGGIAAIAAALGGTAWWAGRRKD